MSLTTPLSAQQQTDPAWQARDTLDEIFYSAGDLHSACFKALPVLLQAAGLESGALLVLETERGPLLVQHGLGPGWSGPLSEPTSPLRQAALRCLQPGGPEQSIDAPGPALLLPLPPAEQAALLAPGTEISGPARQALAGLLTPLGRAIRAALKREDMQRRARALAQLQSELTHMGYGGPGGKLDEYGTLEAGGALQQLDGSLTGTGQPAVPAADALQAALVRGACQVLDSEVCALVLLNDPTDGWMISKTLDEADAWVYQIGSTEGSGLVRECLHTGQAILTNQPSLDPRFEPVSDGWGDLPVSSFLCAPLLVDGQAIGVLKALNHRRGPFDGFDQDLLAILAVQAANAIHGARVVQQLKVSNADLEASRWELLSSRNTLRAIFDHLPGGLYIVEPDYRLTAVNRVRAQRDGLLPRALVGQVCYQALFKRSEPCAECRVRESLQEARSTQRSERRFSGGDEASDWEISTYPILNEDERVIQAIVLEQDATERRRLESILTQSEKLAAIGQLAAGVAHEINNPLTAIIANAQILHRELPPNSDLQESVDLIARAGARATQVVRNLLDFARKEEYHLGLTDLNETVERALELVQHEVLARGIRLDFAPDPTLPPLLASQDHLQSVWLNLLLNAIDSLDKGPGEIKIVTRKVGSEIHVLVSDNGKGIPPDRLTRIFEPFYTTKAPGRGTGLGLSVSHRIVKQHGGRISVESQLGGGSIFTVILPVS
ncbi:MAG: ATP-binding protein [Chloroflexota bacterium]